MVAALSVLAVCYDIWVLLIFAYEKLDRIVTGQSGQGRKEKTMDELIRLGKCYAVQKNTLHGVSIVAYKEEFDGTMRPDSYAGYCSLDIVETRKLYNFLKSYYEDRRKDGE